MTNAIEKLFRPFECAGEIKDHEQVISALIVSGENDLAEEYAQTLETSVMAAADYKEVSRKCREDAADQPFTLEGFVENEDEKTAYEIALEASRNLTSVMKKAHVALENHRRQ